jgi:hypothetical protein
MQLRNKIVAGVVAAATLGAGVGIGAGVANASGAPVLSTTSRTETLISGKCYYEHQVTRTYYGWSTKAGRYVLYPAPRVTITNSTHCHS